MSAMPARAPQVTRVAKPVAKVRPTAKRKVASKLTLVLSPTMETIHNAVPEGKIDKKKYAIFIAAMICFGLLLLLCVNNLTAKSSFEKRQLQLQVSQLTAQEQQLQREVALKESPGQLLKAARKMGMVPAATPAFLRLSDHKILGVPQPASAGQ